MNNLTPDEIEILAQRALIRAARMAVALAEATNTLVIAKGFDEVGDPYGDIQRRAELRAQQKPTDQSAPKS